MQKQSCAHFIGLSILLIVCYSCNFVYKPIDKSNDLPGPRAKSIKMDNCRFDVLLWKEKKKHTSEFEVNITIDGIKKNIHLRLSLLKPVLADYGENTSGSHYTLLKIKMYKQADSSIKSFTEWITDPSINQPMALTISGGYSYAIAYYFFSTEKKHSNQKMQVNIEGFLEEDGKKVPFREEIAFKKYLYVDIAGN